VFEEFGDGCLGCLGGRGVTGWGYGRVGSGWGEEGLEFLQDEARVEVDVSSD